MEKIFSTYVDEFATKVKLLRNYTGTISGFFTKHSCKCTQLKVITAGLKLRSIPLATNSVASYFCAC